MVYVIRFRSRGAPVESPWWYLGAYEMGTTDPTHAVEYPSRSDAWSAIGEALFLSGYETRVSPTQDPSRGRKGEEK